MSVIDQVLQANEKFAESYDPGEDRRPEPRLAVVTCMHPRDFDIEGVLGLKHSEMDLIGTRGPAVTEEILTELVISTRILGVTEVLIVNPASCDLTELGNAKPSGDSSEATVPTNPSARLDLEQSTKEQILKIRSYPRIPRDVSVRGVIFDEKTGRLREIT